MPASTAATIPLAVRDDRRDRALLRLVASGDSRALERLYVEYHQRLRQFLSRLSKQREIHEEAINETFWIIWQKAGEFRGASRVSTWIMGIAWRCTLKALRQSRDGPTGTEAHVTLESVEPRADEALVQEELGEWIRQGLETLPLEQRATIELAYFLGYSCEEISAMMDCPLNTVKARLFQARIKLRNRLPELGGGSASRA